MEYGETWRVHRRAFHQQFHERAIRKYQEQIARSVQGFLESLLEDPDDLFKHIRL